MSFDFAHTAVAAIAILSLLVAFVTTHPGYSFPYGIGTGGDRRYKHSPFDKKGNRVDDSTAL